ncbi:MAG: hypothetical protein II721_03215 [Bacilli bacterium]|nr:hypothetical protein [Bacilli bacterium]
MKDYVFLEKAIFTFEDVLSTGLNREGALSALSNLKNAKKIVRLRKGLYATINPITKAPYASIYEIGCAIHRGGVIGYLSALHFYGLGHQAVFQATVITPLRYKEEEVDGLSYRFIKGDVDNGVNSSFRMAPILVTDLERTIVDALDRPDLCGGMEEVWNSISLVEYLDEGRVLSNLKRIGHRFTYKKAGFLFQILGIHGLSEHFFDVCKEEMSDRCDDIRDYPTEDKAFSKMWNLIYPLYMNKED